MPVKKRRKKSKMYFGQPVQDAIIRYNASSNPAIKNRIYGEHIAAAFEKMAENLIHTFKFYYFDVPLDNVKHEVVSFMVLQLPKYQPDKGRAFSYFSVVIRYNCAQRLLLPDRTFWEDVSGEICLSV